MELPEGLTECSTIWNGGVVPRSNIILICQLLNVDQIPVGKFLVVWPYTQIKTVDTQKCRFNAVFLSLRDGGVSLYLDIRDVTPIFAMPSSIRGTSFRRSTS